MAEESTKRKLREREELLNKIEILVLSVEKSKGREMSLYKLCEEFNKEMNEMSPLKDNVGEEQPKRKEV